MLTGIYLLLGLILAICAFAAWQIYSRNSSASSSNLREMLAVLQKDIQDARLKDREHLQERIDYVSKLLTTNVQESSKTMQANIQANMRAQQAQFKESTSIIKEVTEKLTKLDETNKQVMNFSSQLEDLQSILKQPKGKGVLSEYWLETMLSHVLQPDQYKMQYKFKNGEIVDAVVFFQEKIIPIDAKFSSEKYSLLVKEKDSKRRESFESEFKKDLKLRIDETAKYIRPDESTTDYAFMFIPAEGIYYDLLVTKVGNMDINRENLIQYAHSRRVLIVSPNTFFAFLQTVIEGLRAVKMQESVHEILKRVEKLSKHIGSYEEYMQKMGANLSTTVNMYNSAYREFQKIDKDVFKLTDGKAGGKADPIAIERPIAHLEGASEKAKVKNLAKAA